MEFRRVLFRSKSTLENYEKLVEATNGNPRELKILVDDFGMYFAQHPEIDTMEVDFTHILTYVYHIENGINTLCRRYMEVLSDVGGKASLNLLRKIGRASCRERVCKYV